MTPRKSTRFIVVHCAATRPHMDIGVKEITQWHRALGWATIGYHYVIRRSGRRELGRPQNLIGSHVKGYNAVSVGICLVGGVGMDGKPESNFTTEQFDSLRRLLLELQEMYPHAEILGHRDLSPDKNGDGKIDSRDWLKACPSFDVRGWFYGG
jgi:N-acetylmuramoyl-L-alanine amidase